MQDKLCRYDGVNGILYLFLLDGIRLVVCVHTSARVFHAFIVGRPVFCAALSERASGRCPCLGRDLFCLLCTVVPFSWGCRAGGRCYIRTHWRPTLGQLEIVWWQGGRRRP